MAYSTLNDLLKQVDEDELIQLTDDEGTGAMDADVVNSAITDADAEIDSYCGTRYSTPFPAAPAMIRKLSCDIAIYNLYARRRNVSEDRQARYDAAVRFLRDVSKGLVTLGAGSPDPVDGGGPQATAKKSDRIYTLGRGGSGSLDNF